MFDTGDARLTDLAGQLAVCAGQDLADVPVSLLADDVPALARLVAMATGELVRRLAVVDRSGEGVRLGGSTVSWLADVARMDHSDAHALVATARALVDRLPATATALSHGDVSLRHAQTLARGVTVERAAAAEQHYPGGMAAAEAHLLDVAVLGTPRETYRAIGVWGGALDPGPLQRTAEAQHRARELHLATTMDGMLDVRGRLDADSGAAVLAAVQAAATRSSIDDPRSPAQRRADALTALCRSALACGTLTGTGATVEPAPFDGSPRTSTISTEATQLPDRGGERPQVAVTVDLATLTRQPGHHPGRLDNLDGPVPVTADTARRIACDATISRILTDGPSEILDVGRRTRTVPAALRRALVARDGGCVHPGCTRPPADCDAHHLHHWADGGTTDQHNLALLCPRHHRLVHEQHRTLRHDHRTGRWTTRPAPPPPDAFDDLGTGTPPAPGPRPGKGSPHHPDAARHDQLTGMG